jgi:predicted DNA-binding protein (UPF0251 family)
MTDPATYPSWQQHMFAELEALPPHEQFKVAGAWITQITQSLLPELGRIRRENVLELLAQEGASIPTVAGELGMRRNTVSRLVDEGRSARRHALIEERALQLDAEEYTGAPGSMTTGFSARTAA